MNKALLKGQKDIGEIRSIYNPEGEELTTLRYVYDRYYKMQDNRMSGPINYDNLWDKCEKQWDAWRPPRETDDWQSDIYIPITTSVIEAQLSEIIEQELMPWIVEKGPKDQAKARVMNAIMEYTWETSKSNVALFDILKDALIYGTGIGQEYYWKQPRKIKDDNGKEVMTLEYDDCYLEPVRLYDFFIDERARAFTGPFQANDCIRRYIMDIDDFLTFFSGNIWDPLGNAKLVHPGGDINYYEFYHPPERIEHDREVEVLWYWNKPQDLLAIVANDVMVKMGPNPYKHKQLPFVRVIDVKRPYQFYGKGEAELLSSLQEETNVLRRMVIDRNHLDLDKQVFVSDTLNIEDEDTVARPHGVTPVGDVNQIKFAEYGDIAQSVFRSIDLITDDKVRVTGMDERQQSVSTSGTATEAAILKEATLKRINMKIWQMKYDSLVDIGRLRVQNIVQFYSTPKLFALTNNKDAAEAQANGSLMKVNGKKYSAQYRSVRLKDQAFQINDQTKQPEIIPAKGFTFFDAKPEWFLPQHGGYDIRFKTTTPVPLSKPLQQQKIDEMYDRLIKNPTVDQWKLADAEIRSRDLDPDDFKKQATSSSTQGIDLQKVINLAGLENSQMMDGKNIGPTPYAPVVHTQLHVEYMKSDDFKKLASDQVMKIFGIHVKGELMAQQSRGGQAGAMGQPGQSQPGMMGQGATMGSTGGAINASEQDVVPESISGGDQAPAAGAMEPPGGNGN